MKLKNHYAWVCLIWIIATIFHSVNCVVNFVDGKIVFAFIFLVLSVAFGFVSGMLLEKAIEIHKHNLACDWLHTINEYLKEEAIKQIKPFEEFDNE